MAANARRTVVTARDTILARVRGGVLHKVRHPGDYVPPRREADSPPSASA